MNWDESEAKRGVEQSSTITLKKKQLERLLILCGSVGVLTGFAIYANFFAPVC